MVRYGTDHGIRVTTNTNLTLLNPERTERLVKSGLHTLHFSIGGSTPETYECIRKRAYFDRLLNNVAMLLETKKQFGNELPHLHIVMVIVRQNLTELPDLVQMAHSWNAEEMFVQHLSHDFGDGPAAWSPHLTG